MNSVNHRRHLPYRIEFVIEGDLFSRAFVPQLNHGSCSLHTEVLQVHDLCKPAAGHENSSLFVSWDQGVFFGPPNPERFLKSCVSILAEEDMLCFAPMVQTAPLLQDGPFQSRLEPVPRSRFAHALIPLFLLSHCSAEVVNFGVSPSECVGRFWLRESSQVVIQGN